MRKTLVQTLLAAFCAILATAPLEGGGVMLIYGRNAMFGGAKLSAKSYVRDGLVAMWDGIENAGWGKHDSNAATWVDLSGNGYNLIQKGIGGHWGDGFFEFYGTYPFYNALFPCALGIGPWSVECVYLLSQSMKNYTGLFGTRVGNAFGIYGLNYWSDVGGYNCGTGSVGANDVFTYNNSSAQISPFTTTMTWHQIGIEFRNASISILANSGEIVKTTLGWTPADDAHEGWSRANGILVGAAYCNPASNLGNSDSSRTFKGRIGALRIYNKLLSESELAANYAVDKARFNLPDAT